MGGVELRRRALAALRGLAAGDAMGAATEGYRPEEIADVYDAAVAELLEPVNLYPESEPDRGWGQVGPVTRSALATVDLIAGGGILKDAGSLGWAVSLGIVLPDADPESAARAAARLAHGRGAALGAAVAVAVAAGVNGLTARDAVAVAARAAGHAGDPTLAHGIIAAAGAGQGSGGREAGMVVGAEFPPGPTATEAVVFAFGVAFGTQSARRAIPQAVNQGGLASLTAGLAGAICGALIPATLVESWAGDVEAASGLDLEAVVDRLLAHRATQNRVS